MDDVCSRNGWFCGSELRPRHLHLHLPNSPRPIAVQSVKEVSPYFVQGSKRETEAEE